MKSKTIMGVALLLMSALLLGSRDLIAWIESAQASQVIVLSPQIMAHSAATSVKPGVPPVMSTADQLLLGRNLQSEDPQVRQEALRQLHELSATDPRSLAIGLPQWVAPLIDTRQYKELEAITLPSILERSFDPVAVQAAQRATVLVLIAQENYSQALKAAKSYYNVASLSESGEAIDLLTQILRKTNDPLAAAQFKSEQTESSGGSSILRAVEIDATPYQEAIARLEGRSQKQLNSYGNLMARGNLLLLSDQPVEAKQCFQSACKTQKVAGKSLRQALEGVAEAIRAQAGNVALADAFIRSIRENPASAGASLVHAGSPPWEELRIVAQQTQLSKLNDESVPSLEHERIQLDQNDSAAASAPQVTSGFEGSTPVYVATISPTHLVVEITTAGFRDWFMFQVHGVAGKTVRIDITGAYKTVPNWAQKCWSLNPVYSYASTLDDPSAFASKSASGRLTPAANNSMLPDTEGQDWHYISDVWSDDYTLSFVEHFDQDSAYIAMRVPRTANYNQEYFRQLASVPTTHVVEIGRSVKNRPLLLAQIGEARPDKPCIVIYAGEHADEQDAGWVAQGAVEYLTGNSAGAIDLRNRFTYLVIPMLDPDAAAAGVHESIISSFLAGRTTQESVLYANWFQHWIDSNQRLDLVIDLHNVQSAEGPHVFCPLIEGAGLRGKTSLSLHQLMVKNIYDGGYGIQASPQMRGWMPNRLGGWLSHNFGPLSIAYEVNSQAPERHLTLVELKELGTIFANTAGRFLATSDGAAAMADIDLHRRDRLSRRARSEAGTSQDNAIVSEAATIISGTPGSGSELIETAIP